jgi:hypothetical protein
MLHNTDRPPSTSVFFILFPAPAPYFRNYHPTSSSSTFFRHLHATSGIRILLPTPAPDFRHQHPTSCTSTLLPSPEFSFRRLGPYFRRQHPTSATSIQLLAPASFFRYPYPSFRGDSTLLLAPYCIFSPEYYSSLVFLDNLIVKKKLKILNHLRRNRAHENLRKTFYDWTVLQIFFWTRQIYSNWVESILAEVLK